MIKHGKLTAWCRRCGDEFGTHESSSDEFCSWSCEERYESDVEAEEAGEVYREARYGAAPLY